MPGSGAKPVKAGKRRPSANWSQYEAKARWLADLIV
jgi:hypothetical protein